MKTLKMLREGVRAFNLDTDEELDLDALADIDLDSLFADGFADDEETEYTPLDFNDIGNIALDDYVDDDDEFTEFADDEFSELGDDEFADLDDGLDDTDSDDDMDLDSFSLDDDAGELGDDAGELGDEVPEEDMNFQGEIRTVRGANLVFKRKSDDGNYEELWIYNVGNDIKRETQIRRGILSGTDIVPSSQESKDGSQRANSSTTGNVQFLHISGLPQ